MLIAQLRHSGSEAQFDPLSLTERTGAMDFRGGSGFAMNVAFAGTGF